MITILGSINMDLILQTERIPQVGETVLGHDFRQVSGGKGANQAVACARLGSEVKMIGAVGKDDMGSTLSRALEAEKIDCELIRRSELPTGLAMILVDAKGNNSITVASGANFDLLPEQLEAAKPSLEKSSVFLAQLENPLPYVSEALKLAHSLGVTTVLNPAPAADLDAELYQSIDLLTPNETELAFLSGQPTDTAEECEKAGRVLLDKGLRCLIVTRGAEGCLLMQGEEVRHLPSYRVKMVDSTAAGDCFNGGLVSALDKNQSLEEAIDFAMKAAAISVTVPGAQPSLPHLEDLENFPAWYPKHRVGKDHA